MSYATVMTACLVGPSVVPVRIEVDVQPGLPQFQIIGLGDKKITEAKERVRSALRNSGFRFPQGKITVNLAPSYLPKSGTALDLGIALALLASQNKLPHLPKSCWFLGELSLEGVVRPISSLPALLVAAVQYRLAGCFVPDQKEVVQVPECPVIKANNLLMVVNQLQQPITFPAAQEFSSVSNGGNRDYYIDQVLGQDLAKRVLLITLAGGHNLLMTGPAGVGKTMLAQASAELLPALSRQEALQAIKLYSLAGEPLGQPDRPPFRSPHHTVSKTGLYGGGLQGQPGEISLASKGVLFLDEFPEMSREVREMLRQPMQEKQVRLSRLGLQHTYPADCIVMAAMNPCPCGLRGGSTQSCRCTPGDLNRYERALSEPILDRFDLFFTLSPVDGSPATTNSSYRGEAMARCIADCRNRPPVEDLSPAAAELLRSTVRYYQISMRSQNSLIRVAGTIARLEAQTRIEERHVQEAVQYRRRPLQL